MGLPLAGIEILCQRLLDLDKLVWWAAYIRMKKYVGLIVWEEPQCGVVKHVKSLGKGPQHPTARPIPI